MQKVAHCSVGKALLIKALFQYGTYSVHKAGKVYESYVGNALSTTSPIVLFVCLFFPFSELGSVLHHYLSSELGDVWSVD